MENKKITLATLKSFLKKNEGKLLIKMESSFDGMTDMVEVDRNAEFKPATKTESNLKNTAGFEGVWLVGSSKNYFEKYDNIGGDLTGIHVWNCCGSFTVAVRK